jgi:stearoyl-CoA desaturase (delta-9 desaturase)
MIRFSTEEDSRDNWWVALLTFGESWDNSIHLHRNAARHELAWYEIDINWWAIRVMQFVGLARTVKLVTLAHRFLAL